MRSEEIEKHFILYSLQGSRRAVKFLVENWTLKQDSLQGHSRSRDALGTISTSRMYDVQDID